MLILKNLDWNEILEQLEKCATSELVRSQLRSIQALEDVDQAKRSFLEITEAQSILATGSRPYMESLDFYKNWQQRLMRGAVLQLIELKDVRRFCLESIALTEVLRPLRGIWIDQIKSFMMNAYEPLAEIDQVMTAQGDIRSDASHELEKLYKEKTQQIKNLQNTLDRIVKNHQMESVLQERYVTTREGRWVLPVKGGMQHAFAGIIHASSQSKQTVFMEPEEVIPLNNRLKQIEIEISEEIERILTELSNDLASQLVYFDPTQRALMLADYRLAQARFAELIDAQACEFCDPQEVNQNELKLIDVRHPLLALKSKDAVANSILLNKDQKILLLSGPNAGGKTVLLKSIGLACYMASCGLLVCAAQESKIPFFNSILTAIGDSQSVDAALSTFAAHLKLLESGTHLSGPQNLILIDEICGSTDPEEGSALARSFIESYCKQNVYAVITSHLGPLKTGWETQPKLINGSMEFDTHTGQATYKFIMGIPGRSMALMTAKRVGINTSIIDRALELLSPKAKIEHDYLSELEKLKDSLHKKQNELEHDSRSAREAKRKYSELIHKFKKEKDEWLDRYLKKMEKKIDHLISEANVDQIFKRHEKLSQIKHEMPEIVKSSSISNLSKKIESAEEFEKAYPPGSPVFVPHIGQEGLVQGKANAKGEIPVLSNSMRLMVHWQQLKGPQNSSNPTSQILRKHTQVQVSLRDSDRSLDLRGLRVDEAIMKLEIALDQASLQSEDRIKIIHGHGTESLKKAIRAHLSRSVYVKSWKAPSVEMGGDGITWAELKD